MEALAAGELGLEHVGQIAREAAEPFEAVQVAIEEEAANEQPIGENIAEAAAEDVNDAPPIEDIVWVGNAVLVRHLNPDSGFWDLVDTMKLVGGDTGKYFLHFYPSIIYELIFWFFHYSVMISVGYASAWVGFRVVLPS